MVRTTRQSSRGENGNSGDRTLAGTGSQEKEEVVHITPSDEESDNEDTQGGRHALPQGESPGTGPSGTRHGKQPVRQDRNTFDDNDNGDGGDVIDESIDEILARQLEEARAWKKKQAMLAEIAEINTLKTQQLAGEDITSALLPGSGTIIQEYAPSSVKLPTPSKIQIYKTTNLWEFNK